MKFFESFGENMTALATMGYWMLESAPPIGPKETKKITTPFPAKIIDMINSKFGERFSALAIYINQHVPIFLHNIIDDTISPAYYQYASTNQNPEFDEVHLYFPMAIRVDTTNHTINFQKDLTKPQITELMTYFAHEFRHVMQRREFGDYFDKITSEHRDSENPDDYYHQNQLEIDAALHHLALSVLDQDEFTGNIHDYVNEVMRRFSEYKRLTPKQYKHYRRKAANIFAYFNAQGQEQTTGSTRDRMEKQVNLRKERLKNVIVPFINNNWSFIRDLRKYGMDKPAFWKKKSYMLNKNFPSVMEKMFTRNKSDLSENREVYIIFYALLNLAATQLGYKLPIANLYDLFGFSPMTYKEAMRNPKAREIFGNYDSTFINYALGQLPKDQAPK